MTTHTNQLELHSIYLDTVRAFTQSMLQQGMEGIWQSAKVLSEMLEKAVVFDCRRVSCSLVHKTSVTAARKLRKLAAMPHLPLLNEPCYFEFEDGFHIIALEMPEALEVWKRVKQEVGITDQFVGEGILLGGERIMLMPIGQRLIYGVPGSIGKGAKVRHELQGESLKPNSPAACTALAIERAAARMMGLLSLLAAGRICTETLADRRVLTMVNG